MSVIALIFVVGLANLGLGYMLAVRLGYGPSSLQETWDLLAGNGAVRGAPGIAADALTEDAASELGASAAEFKPEGEMAPAAQSGESPEIAEPAGSAGSSLETSVLAVRKALLGAEATLTEIDAQVWSSEPSAVSMIETHLQTLQTSCEECRAELEKASGQIQVQAEEVGELKSVGQEIDAALVEQSAQIEATLGNLRQIDAAANPQSALRRLAEEIVTVAGTMHRLRDRLEAAYAAILRQENRLSAVEEGLGTDLITSLPNRIGLERVLHHWCQEGWQRTEPHSAALLDIDAFTKINQEYGVAAGSQVLRTVAQRVRDALGENGLVARYGGQRLALLLSGVEPAAAMETAERVCTAAEDKEIACGEMSVKVTVSGGVIGLVADDTSQSVVDRLERAVAEAKKAGPGKLLLAEASP